MPDNKNNNQPRDYAAEGARPRTNRNQQNAANNNQNQVAAAQPQQDNNQKLQQAEAERAALQAEIVALEQNVNRLRVNIPQPQIPPANPNSPDDGVDLNNHDIIFNRGNAAFLQMLNRGNAAAPDSPDSAYNSLDGNQPPPDLRNPNAREGGAGRGA